MALVFRGERFLSIPEAAERLRVTRLTVYRWLRGTRRAPQDIPLHRVIRDTRTQQAYIPRAIVRRLQHALRRRAVAHGAEQAPTHVSLQQQSRHRPR